ncbi:hypothetical protein MKX08_004499 [Trichoderma sp. CBMAI-0020]|nr:hypothetical protein MKX08_004499 [Trichoderma sp. CBMAI-0020]
METGENPNYLVVVIIITDTSQNRALGPRQVEAGSKLVVLGGTSPYPACPAPRPLFATGERAAATAHSDLVPRWAGLEG